MNNRKQSIGLGFTILIAAVSAIAAGCGAQDSGGEDVSAATEALTIGVASKSPDYFECATEGGTCVTGSSTPKYVAFGHRSTNRFKFLPLQGNVSCSVATFGDPAPGTVKKCYVANMRFAVAENGRDVSGVGRAVAFGVDGAFFFKEPPSTTGCTSGGIICYRCDVATFGDPAPGKVKACYHLIPDYARVASEKGTLTGLSNSAVAFGANGKYVYTVASGSMPCTVAAFGSDPVQDVVKSCYQLSMPFLANEPSTYNVPFDGTFLVRYGSGLNGLFQAGSRKTAPCTNATFGGDPHLDVSKRCWGFARPIIE